MKTILYFFYIMCEPLCVVSRMKTFTSPVGLNFASGSGYEDPMNHTPSYIM